MASVSGGLIHTINLEPKRKRLFKSGIDDILKDFGIKKGTAAFVLAHSSPQDRFHIADRLANVTLDTLNVNDVAKLKSFANGKIPALFISGLPNVYQKVPDRLAQARSYAEDFPLNDVAPRMEDWIVESLLLASGMRTFKSPNLNAQKVSVVERNMRFHKDTVEGVNVEKLLLFGNKGLSGVMTAVRIDKHKNLQSDNVCIQNGSLLMINNRSAEHGVYIDKEKLEEGDRWISRYYAEKISPKDPLGPLSRSV